MAEFVLAKREEPASVYDANREINKFIFEKFEKSKAEAIFSKRNVKAPSKRMRAVYAYGEIPYWGILPSGERVESTLENGGCAVFAFEEGLRISRNIVIPMKILVDEICSKGYYYPGRGTWHNLFDHYGLRRATSVNEIFDSLMAGHIITALIDNKQYRYSRGTGSHFINIVGIKGRIFSIDDSSFGRVYIFDDEIITATKVAWIW